MALATPLLSGAGDGGEPSSSTSAADKPHISAHFLHAAQQKLRLQQQLLRSIASSPPADMPSMLPTSDQLAASTQLAAFLQSIHELQLHAAAPPSLQLAEWERSVLSHILLIDAVAVEAVEAAERQKLQSVEDDRAGRTRQFIDKLKQLTGIEQRQLLAISQHFQGIAQQLGEKERLMDEAALRMKAEQRRAMSKVHNRLVAIVSAQKQAMADSYGRLYRSGDLSLAGIRSLLRVPSLPSVRKALSGLAARTNPRVLSIKVNALRAIKDKLPAGQYSLLVTLHPSIASPLPLSAPLSALRLRRLPLTHKSESMWVRHFDWTRVPARHSGKHHACELNFTADEDELFIAAPARQHTALGACLLVQLIAISVQEEAAPTTTNGSGATAGGVSSKRERLNLANNTKPAQHTYEQFYRTDAVVAFGYLPIVQPHTGALVDGKLKLPLLRGDPRTDSTVTAYGHVQQRIAASLDAWLCNAYVEVSEVSGRWRDGYWVVDGDAAEKQRKRERDEARRAEEKRQQLIDAKAKQLLRNEQQSAGWLGFMNSLKKGGTSKGGTAEGGGSGVADRIDRIGRSIEGMEMSAEGKQLHKRQQMRQRVKELQQYRQSVTSNNHLNVTRIQPAHYLRMLLAFVVQATWQDLRYKPGHAVLAAVNVLLLFATWLLCHAIHYASQYWTLISVFNLSVYEVDIRYPLSATFLFDTPSSLAGPQLLVCAIGPFGCYLLLAFLALLTSLLSRCLPLPSVFYTATLFLCLHSLLDPLYVALVDVLSGHWQYNEYALLFAYNRQEQSPYVALLLSALLLLALLLLGSVVLLVYLLALHHQAEYRDLFGRLYSSDAELPLPSDLEVSVRLVRRVMRDAAEYRGSRGTTRRVMVDEYIHVAQRQQAEVDGEPLPQLTDDEDACLHVSIFNVTKRKTVSRGRTTEQPPADDEASAQTSDGSGIAEQSADEQAAAVEERRLVQEQQEREQAVRDSGKEDKELYRHFVRLTDGSWVECLDGVESYGGEEMSQREEEWLLQRERADGGGEEDKERMREMREAEQNEAERLQREQHKREQQRREEEETAKGRIRATPLQRSLSLTGAAAESNADRRRGSLRDGRVAGKEQHDAAEQPAAFRVSITAPTDSSSSTGGVDGGGAQSDPFSMLSPVGRGSVIGRTERMPSLLTTAIVENEEEDEDD